MNASELEAFVRQITKPTPEIIDSFKKSGNPLLELTADALEREAEAVKKNFPKVGALATVFEQLPGPLGAFLRASRERAENLNDLVGNSVQETVTQLEIEAKRATEEANQATNAAKLLGLTGTQEGSTIQLSTLSAEEQEKLLQALLKDIEKASGVESLNPTTSKTTLESLRKELQSGDLPTKIEGARKLVDQVETVIQQNPSAVENYEKSFPNYEEKLGSKGMVGNLLESTKMSIGDYEKDPTSLNDNLKYISGYYDGLLEFLKKANPVEALRRNP